MPQQIKEQDAAALVDAIRQHGGIAGQKEIAASLPQPVSERTLQFRLRRLVDDGRLVREGARRAARYRLPATYAVVDLSASAETPRKEIQPSATAVPLSSAATEIRNYVSQPLEKRRPVGYNRDFLDSYQPNVTFYLSAEDRARLASAGRPNFEAQAAGTYAKQVLNRLLIDLSSNSSRLEGNTYSLLDTKRLIDFGEAAEGKQQLEAQMILNHKAAIEFLVESADDIGFNRYTILNLHALLSDNLLPDPRASGRLRSIPVGIAKSVYLPLAAPQLIAECFQQILDTASAVEDPFEQAFFVMVHL